MAAPRAALLSSDELKAYLLHSLQGRGVLDSLKSQLRNKLATELQKAVECAESGKVRAESEKPAMPVYFANSIVARHLKQMGYEYSLSIFLPEAEVNLDKLPTHSDLLHFMRVSPTSHLYATLEQNNEQGFLVQLLEALPMVLAAPATHCAVVQTDQQFKADSIYDKLQALEETYAQRTEEELSKCQKTLEERILAVQQECEQQYKKQLQTELAHFKERELSEMRLEEKNRSHQELARLRAELESAYRQRNEAVRKMELEMMERMKHKEQDLERSIHAQRQSLLVEMEGLKGKKVELEKKEELGRLQEVHVRKMVEQLESHKSALQAMQQQCEKMAEEKARRYQIEYERNHQARSDELSRQESKLNEYDRLVGKASQLEGLLRTTSAHQVSLQQEKEVLVHKLSEVANLQHKLSETEGQLSDMRRKETGYSNTIKELQNKLATHQKQLDKVTKLHAKDLQAADLDNQNLRTQLDTQCQYNLELQKRLDDQTLELRTAQRELKDLQEQVEHLQAALKAAYKPTTGQPAVKKQVKARSPDPLRSAKKDGARRVLKLGGGDEMWKLQNQGGHELELTDAFLVESKSTFARLEKEAQELERSFHQLGLCRDPVTFADSPPSQLLPPHPLQTSHWHHRPIHQSSNHLLKTPESGHSTAAPVAIPSSPFPLISAIPYPAVTPLHAAQLGATATLVNSSHTADTRALPADGSPRLAGHAHTGHTPPTVDKLRHRAAMAAVVPQSSIASTQQSPPDHRHTTHSPVIPATASHHLYHGDGLLSVAPPLTLSLPQQGQRVVGGALQTITHMSSYPPSHVIALPTSHVTTLPISQVTTLPTSQVTTLPASHVTTLPTSHVTTLPTSQVTTLPTSHVTTLLASHVTTLPTSQVTTLPISQVTTLPTSQVTTLPTSQVTTLPTSQVTILPTSQVTTLPTSQVTTLPTSQVTTLPTSQVTTLPSHGPSSGSLPITSSQQKPFMAAPAVPTFNLDSLWKKATPLAPPPMQATPLAPPPLQATPGSNQRIPLPLSEVAVEDIEDMHHDQTGIKPRHTGNTGMEPRHTGSTGMEPRHIGSTGLEPKHTSDTENEDSHISGMEQGHIDSSGIEQINSSGMEHRHISSTNLESSWETARLQRLREQEAREREEREKVQRELQSLEHTAREKEDQEEEASIEQEEEVEEEVRGTLNEGTPQGDKEQKRQAKEDHIDPLMLKYMELVQKQREQKAQPQTHLLADPLQSPPQYGEVTSQASDAIGVAEPSEHEDAFQDW